MRELGVSLEKFHENICTVISQGPCAEACGSQRAEVDGKIRGQEQQHASTGQGLEK